MTTWTRRLQSIVGLFFLLLGSLMIEQFLKLLLIPGPGGQNWVLMAFALAIVFGLIAGLALAQAAQAFALALVENRAEKMLVELWDERIAGEGEGAQAWAEEVSGGVAEGGMAGGWEESGGAR